MSLQSCTQTKQIPETQPATGQNPTTPSFTTVDGDAQSPNGNADPATQSSKSQYDPRNDVKVQKFVTRICSRRKKTNEAVRDDGEDLWKLKQYLKCHGAHHGHWERICEEDLDTHPRTALRKIQYYNAWERAKDEGKSDIMSEIDPSVIYKVCASTVPEAALEEVLQKAESGEKIKIEDADEIVKRHRSGQEDEPEGDDNKDSSDRSTAAGPGANDDEASAANESKKTTDVNSEAAGPPAADTEGKAGSNPEVVSDPKVTGDPETGSDPKADSGPEADGAPEAARDAGAGTANKTGSENDGSGAAEDEDAIRQIEIFASAISAAEGSFSKMDNQTKQKALKLARKKHLDFLNAITALAS